MRRGPRGGGRDGRDPTGDQAQQVGAAILGAGLEQQLLAQTDAEQRPLEPPQGLDQTERIQPLHGVTRRADARQDDPLGLIQISRIGADPHPRAQPLQRKPHRGDIARAVTDQGDVHSTPLVDGTTSPSTRMA
ncbi:hypothetical protein D3C71_1701330 [compost metagenome]